MHRKIIGILVCMLLIITVFPASGNNLEKTSNDIPDVTIVIKSGNYPDTILGCKGEVWYSGDDNITLDVSFTVISYSLQGEYLGESSKIFELTFTHHLVANPHIIPDYYGETFTWVYAKLDVKNVDNSEQTESVFKIGLSIGKWIHFSIGLAFIYHIINLLTKC